MPASSACNERPATVIAGRVLRTWIGLWHAEECRTTSERLGEPDVTPDYYMKCYVARPLGGAIEINRARPKTVRPSSSGEVEAR